MGYETLLEKFCFSGEEAATFDEQIGSYWNVDNNVYLPDEVVLGDQLLNHFNKTYRFMNIKDRLLYIQRRKEAKSILEIMSTVKIK